MGLEALQDVNLLVELLPLLLGEGLLLDDLHRHLLAGRVAREAQVDRGVRAPAEDLVREEVVAEYGHSRLRLCVLHLFRD